jgi:hypothetical protein
LSKTQKTALLGGGCCLRKISFRVGGKLTNLWVPGLKGAFGKCYQNVFKTEFLRIRTGGDYFEKRFQK